VTKDILLWVFFVVAVITLPVIYAWVAVVIFLLPPFEGIKYGDNFIGITRFPMVKNGKLIPRHRLVLEGNPGLGLGLWLLFLLAVAIQAIVFIRYWPWPVLLRFLMV